MEIRDEVRGGAPWKGVGAWEGGTEGRSLISEAALGPDAVGRRGSPAGRCGRAQATACRPRARSRTRPRSASAQPPPPATRTPAFGSSCRSCSLSCWRSAAGRRDGSRTRGTRGRTFPCGRPAGGWAAFGRVVWGSSPAGRVARSARGAAHVVAEVEVLFFFHGASSSGGLSSALLSLSLPACAPPAKEFSGAFSHKILAQHWPRDWHALALRLTPPSKKNLRWRSQRKVRSLARQGCSPEASMQSQKNFLPFLPPSETGDTHTPVSDQGDCPRPRLPCLRRIACPETATLSEGHCARRGCVDFFIFALFVLSGERSFGAHGLLRFRTNDVLLGTSGAGVCQIRPPSHMKRSPGPGCEAADCTPSAQCLGRLPFRKR